MKKITRLIMITLSTAIMLSSCKDAKSETKVEIEVTDESKILKLLPSEFFENGYSRSGYLEGDAAIYFTKDALNVTYLINGQEIMEKGSPLNIKLTENINGQKILKGDWDNMTAGDGIFILYLEKNKIIIQVEGKKGASWWYKAEKKIDEKLYEKLNQLFNKEEKELNSTSDDKTSEINLSELPSQDSNEAIVITNKTYFYETSNFENKRKAFLVEGDNIDFTGEENGFLYASFTNSNGKTTSGWISKNDIKIIQKSTKAKIESKYIGNWSNDNSDLFYLSMGHIEITNNSITYYSGEFAEYLNYKIETDKILLFYNGMEGSLKWNSDKKEDAKPKCKTQIGYITKEGNSLVLNIQNDVCGRLPNGKHVLGKHIE